MFIIYDFVFLLFAFVCLPLYLLKKKFHKGFLARLGMLSEGLSLDRPIWIHAVSVGEVMSIKKMLEELKLAYPGKKFVISTVTPTGNKIARGIARPSDFVTYLPLDLSFIVRPVIDKINPCLFIIAETEIWPNLISCLYKKNIPVMIVNARISERSFKGYLSVKYLLRPILEKINQFCAQSETDAQRLLCLGVNKDKLRITGNLKFDSLTLAKAGVDYRAKLGLGAKEKLFIAASTHSGEEEIILAAYAKLKEGSPDLRLLIAPRHPERSPQVCGLVKKTGFWPLRIGSLGKEKSGRQEDEAVFILDTIGELIGFYAIADIVFVGGSLVKKGGHNILEPASLGKPVLFGPYMFNFRDIAGVFLKAEAALAVHNGEELKEKIEYLLGNHSKIDEMARRGRELISENQGATKRNLESIRKILEGDGK